MSVQEERALKNQRIQDLKKLERNLERLSLHNLAYVAGYVDALQMESEATRVAIISTAPQPTTT